MMVPLLSFALLVGAFAPQKAGSEPLAAELEVRVQRLGKTLRCTTCQGLSIADSPASMARSQLDKVREMVSAGKTDDEIRAYFVARYGEWALLEPPKHGWNLVVWAGPVLLLLLGAGAIFAQLKRRPLSPAEAPSGPAPAPESQPGEDAYLRALREELER